MPTIYRIMKKADDGLPVVGSNSNELGVRVSPNPHADVDLDDRGNVILNEMGLSVAVNWRNLPDHLVPKRLRAIRPKATGSDKYACYRFGDGPFQAGPINDRLALVLKAHDPKAGNVVPSQLQPVQAFQDDLAATRPGWSIDET